MSRANNSFNLSGRLAADPDIDTSGTTPRARLRLAVDGWDYSTKSKKADFFSITVWGKDVSRVQMLQKGAYISVTGELRENKYVDKTGNNRVETQLVSSDIAFGPRAASTSGSSDPNDPFGFSN